MELHDIGWAVRKLRLGEKVYRTGWNGPNQYLKLQQCDEHSKMTLPYVYMVIDHGERMPSDLVPWLCSQTDLLAEDWELRS
jgi:uncharacterized protein DUF2829